MEAENIDLMLLPPMKTPRGWFVVYQGQYKSPNVFDLNETARFTKRPVIASGIGARLLASDGMKLAIQYMKLVESASTDEATGEKYFFINKNGLVFLTDDLKLEPADPEKERIDKEIMEEVIKVYNEWLSTLSNRDRNIETFVMEFKKSLVPAIEKGKKIAQDWFIKNNSPWIDPYLPRMMHDFRYGVYECVSDILYESYKGAGGGDTEDDLIKKINLFMKIYESRGLEKPNGGSWRSEDELWDCWTAFAGSEVEAVRICRTMEEILLPLKEGFKKNHARD
jgi:hypothetical protein